MDPVVYSSYREPGQSWKSKILEFVETLVVFGAIFTAIYLFIAQPHKVSGQSMFPTLHSGDYIFTDKVTYRLSEPQIGQIIVFKNPRQEDQDFIKRIIGTPGDLVKVEEGKVYVNRNLLDEFFYLNSSVITDANAFLSEGKEIRVPQEKYIVMGDNRGASSDSREWGFITKEEIIGKAFLRYWPINGLGIVRAADY